MSSFRSILGQSWNFEIIKGQLISKAIYGLLTSLKKQMDEFVLFAFLLFTANKSNSSVRFLGESTALQAAFWFYLTFSKGHLISKQIFFFSFEPKTQRNYFAISALASKKSSNQKNFVI